MLAGLKVQPHGLMKLGGTSDGDYVREGCDQTAPHAVRASGLGMGCEVEK